MAWSGKVLGGLFGGMVGGPLGMGVGVALGHYLADSAGAQEARGRGAWVQRLEWRHHAFGESGPGVLLTPVWLARGLKGKGVSVTVSTPDYRHKVVIEPEHPAEECHLPEVLLPYAFVGDALTVTVRVDAGADGHDEARFEVPLPSAVRRLGLSGPGRVVMALVATARAGGRALTREDVRFIRERFEAAHPLDDDGRAWLKAWMRTLRDADLPRLSADKVAARLAPHVDGESAGRVLTWLMHGARGVWPGEAQVAFIEALGAGLGLPPEEVSALWQRVDRPVDPDARREALATLGLEPDAPPEAVREAWRRLVRLHHPDRARTPDAAARATTRTAELNAAYDLLTR